MPDEYSIFLWVLMTYCQMNMQDFQLGCDPLIVEYFRLQPVNLIIIRRVTRSVDSQQRIKTTDEKTVHCQMIQNTT